IEASELGYDVEYRRGKRELRLHGVSSREIGEVLDELDSHGVEYDEFRWKQPGLEQVYLNLTGKEEFL
ncbi:MAG: hypothetical protein SXQ77_02150, partial [Halobacteria archaeon]|nr:hypothetical protein [Halobacteria archaeon]